MKIVISREITKTMFGKELKKIQKNSDIIFIRFSPNASSGLNQNKVYISLSAAKHANLAPYANSLILIGCQRSLNSC